MEKEKVQFSWTMSVALDRKARWLTALTTAGAYTTANMQRTSRLIVVFPRQLHRQTLSILVVYRLLNWIVR